MISVYSCAVSILNKLSICWFDNIQSCANISKVANFLNCFVRIYKHIQMKSLQDILKE